MFIGTDLHSCEQRLRIRRLNAHGLQLGGPDVIVEQRRRDEVFEIVISLLFGLGMILRTIATTSREIEGSLEDVASHALDICRHQAVAALQIQHSFQHRLAMNERAVFLEDRLRDDLKRGILPIYSDRLPEHALQPVGAFEQTAWALEAALCQPGSVDSAHPRHSG